MGRYIFMPHSELSPGVGRSSCGDRRAATDKTLNPVNCACPQVSRAPISARSLSLQLRDRRSCLWQPHSRPPQPDFAVDFSKFAIPHAGLFNPRHGTPCRDPRHGIRNAIVFSVTSIALIYDLIWPKMLGRFAHILIQQRTDNSSGPPKFQQEVGG